MAETTTTTTEQGLTWRVWAAQLNGRIDQVAAQAQTATEAEARAIAATFPKSAKVSGHRSSRQRDGEWVEEGGLDFHAKLSSDKVNGGANETGLRRYRSWRRAAEARGDRVEWVTPWGNSLSEADFLALTA